MEPTEYKKMIAMMAMTLFSQIDRSKENMEYSVRTAKELAKLVGIEEPKEEPEKCAKHGCMAIHGSPDKDQTFVTIPTCDCNFPITCTAGAHRPFKITK